MKKFYLYVLLVLSIFLSCQKKSKKDIVLRNEEQFSLNDTLYEDYDLFNFKPINNVNLKDNSPSFLKIINEKHNSKIVISINSEVKELLLKKENKFGCYTYTQSFEQEYVKEYLYTVFLKNVIMTFVLNKNDDETDMTLTSYRVLLPINKKTFLQREMIFKLENSIVVSKFEEIDVQGFLKKNLSDFEDEYFYKFNYSDKSCIKYYHNVENDKWIFETEYSVFNSKSMASPYYYYWKVKR